MNVAIIPARGGSKRIPGKNIKDFCGKPMLAWSIEAAKESECFEHIIVSTDDEKIAEVAKKWGAEVPFMRPPNLADDYTGTIPVIAHAVKWINRSMGGVENACCIYATAPFLTGIDLQNGLQIIQSKNINYAFSVTSYAFPIQRAIRITQNLRVEMFYPEHFHTRSQDLEEAWHDAGQFYWGKSRAWIEQRPLFATDSVPIRLPRHRVQDIDTMEDWSRAEWLFKSMHGKFGAGI
jgi:N-acylneuraminate cytidylyltransferase